MSLLVALALGLGLGIVTGMPLGVINIAIVDAAAAGHKRFAIGIGVGGALADTIHAALAFVGLGALVTARPEIVRVLGVVAAIAIVGYAVLAWRRARTTPQDGRRTFTSGSETPARAIAIGFLLTLPNPGALSAWVAVAAALWPGAQPGEAIALAAGVGVGSAAWFVLLANLVGKLPRQHRALRVIPKLALVAFVAIAIAGVVRVL